MVTLFIVLLFILMISCGEINDSSYTGLSSYEYSQISWVAHRGVSLGENGAPENTIAAFELAASSNCSAIETDVRETKDGVFVLIHDDNIQRMTGVDLSVSHSAYSDLNNITINNGCNVALYPSETIPRLEELLTLCVRADKIANLEIKNVRNIDKLIDVIIKSGAQRHVSLLSFSHETMLNLFRRIDVPYSVNVETIEGVANTLTFIERNNVDCGINILHSIVDEEMVYNLNCKGIDLNCWVVDDWITAKKLYDMGVRTITTNKLLTIKQVDNISK